MRTHPLWNPFQPPSMGDVMAARARLGVWKPSLVEVVAPDSAWPQWFAVACGRLAAALGDRVLAIEHIGSTAVPGMWAKPMIDIDLMVADSADEDAWLPDLESVGFELRAREPDWEEHRVLRGQQPATNLHVCSPGAREPHRHRMFRDWLRAHPRDRDRYGQVKRELAGRGFTDQMLYNNEKAPFIYDLYETIFAADPDHEHDSHPRPPTPAPSADRHDAGRHIGHDLSVPGYLSAACECASCKRCAYPSALLGQ